MPAKLGVGDVVRFIGTDTPYVVKEYNPTTLEYRVQCGDERGSQWASEIYFELLESPDTPAEASNTEQT
jgi:hypothetical protein